MRYVIIKNGRFFHCFNLVQQEMKRRPVVVYRVFKTNYPSLQNAEINALIAVCIAILRVNVSIPTLLFHIRFYFRRLITQMRCKSKSSFKFLFMEIWSIFFSSAKSWAKSLEKPLHLGHIDSSREIPHSMYRLVLCMPLMFKGTSNGYVLFFICFLSMFSSRLFNIHVRALTQMTPTKDAFAAEVIAYWVPN